MAVPCWFGDMTVNHVYDSSILFGHLQYKLLEDECKYWSHSRLSSSDCSFVRVVACGSSGEEHIPDKDGVGGSIPLRTTWRNE